MWVGRGGCGWWEYVCASIVYRCSHMCIVCVCCVHVLCVYMCVFCVCVCVCVCVYMSVCARVFCVFYGVNVCCERGEGVWKE